MRKPQSKRTPEQEALRPLSLEQVKRVRGGDAVPTVSYATDGTPVARYHLG
jgi:hypothetical protein